MARSLPHTGLPIEDVLPQIKGALVGAGSVVVVAPPGSGKTTIVPLHLLDEAWVGDRKIVVLEPRRLATRAAARRMAQLLGERVGATVGYVTRGDRQVSRNTRIEVVTEGVLTRRLQHNPELDDTAAVIFDEVHERNLQTDLGLALTLDVRDTIRPDLRIVVMSATVSATDIAGHIGIGGPSPIVESDARAYPIDVFWAPLRRQTRIESHTAHIVQRALRSHDGDVLVFLSGMAEIRRVEQLLREAEIDAHVRLLHGSLSVDQQDLALAASFPGERKVVLSTDVAETSLTVEGVRIVIDTGRTKSPRFDPRTGMTRLLTHAISKASADQRSGRAGRTEPGVAYRLWSKVEHGSRQPYIEPEIASVDLTGLVLELAAWGVNDVTKLRWLDTPPVPAWNEAVELLRLLGGVDDAGMITDKGRTMVGLPLHPRLARMVADAGSQAWLACILAALIDERDVLGGRPDEVPVDLALRVRIVDGLRKHPLERTRTIDTVRRTASDIARRAGITEAGADPERAGFVLAHAFPDRLAVLRGSPGRYQLRTGNRAWINEADELAPERFLIPADLDGKRNETRIRLAAAIDAEDVSSLFSDDVVEQKHLRWLGNRLVERRERKLGGVALNVIDVRPEPSEGTTAALMKRVGERGLNTLPWHDSTTSLCERVTFLHRHVGDPWPDWSQDQLLTTLADWLVPYIGHPSGLDDLESLDLTSILRGRLGHRLSGELARLTPLRLELPSGRRVKLDYSTDVPIVKVKVQELYGTTTTPTVGGVPVVLHLLSPADRPIQITSDLAGFWEGSWREVRKEMAARYPKHNWPANPANVPERPPR